MKAILTYGGRYALHIALLTSSFFVLHRILYHVPATFARWREESRQGIHIRSYPHLDGTLAKPSPSSMETALEEARTMSLRTGREPWQIEAAPKPPRREERVENMERDLDQISDVGHALCGAGAAVILMGTLGTYCKSCSGVSIYSGDSSP